MLLGTVETACALTVVSLSKLVVESIANVEVVNKTIMKIANIELIFFILSFPFFCVLYSLKITFKNVAVRQPTTNFSNFISKKIINKEKEGKVMREMIMYESTLSVWKHKGITLKYPHPKCFLT